MKRFDADQVTGHLKEKILDAASERFRLFGFRKTTMADIAKDLGMSTANLYRYYPSKLDIAEGFALRLFVEKEGILSTVLEQESTNSTQCLRAFAQAILSYVYQEQKNYPTINEIVEALCDERPELVERKIAGELDLLKQILLRGQAHGDWAFEDIDQTGHAILASWVLFSTPTFMALKTHEELKQMLSGVIDLTINGLRKRE